MYIEKLKQEVYEMWIQIGKNKFAFKFVFINYLYTL